MREKDVFTEGWDKIGSVVKFKGKDGTVREGKIVEQRDDVFVIKTRVGETKAIRAPALLSEEPQQEFFAKIVFENEKSIFDAYNCLNEKFNIQNLGHGHEIHFMNEDDLSEALSTILDYMDVVQVSDNVFEAKARLQENETNELSCFAVRK